MHKGNLVFKLDAYLLVLMYSIWLFSPQSNKYLQYSPLIILLLYFLLKRLFTNIRSQIKTGFIWSIIILLVWVYGVMQGLFRENDNVFRNNVGMIFFCASFALLKFKLDIDKVINVFLLVVIANIINYILRFDLSLSALTIAERGAYTYGGIMPMVLFPFLLMQGLFNFPDSISKMKRLFYIIILLSAVTVSIISVLSKGVILATGFFMFLVLLRAPSSRMRIFVAVCILFLFSIEFVDYDISIFGAEDKGNKTRYKIISLMKQDFTFFGRGWGARFTADFLKYRNGTGYSTELSYLNLIDKIGVFAGVLYSYYIFSLKKVIQFLFSSNSDEIKIGLLGLGAMTNLFVALGNPSLFAPIWVFTHVLIISLHNRSRNYKSDFNLDS